MTSWVPASILSPEVQGVHRGDRHQGRAVAVAGRFVPVVATEPGASSEGRSGRTREIPVKNGALHGKLMGNAHEIPWKS